MKKFLVLILTLALLFVSCGESTEISFAVSDDAKDIVADANISFSDDVSASVESSTVGDDVISFIDVQGNITNNSGEEIAVIILTFGIYNTDGARLTSASTAIENLGDGETWKFTAPANIENEEYGSFELVDVKVS